MSNAAQNNVTAKILLVDDTPGNLRLLATILNQQGYNVRPARDGQMALSSAQADPPDLILLDIMMPGLNGYEVCKQLKANKLTQDIPIIFISAMGEIVDKIKGFHVGGVDYITKPFQMEEVLIRVETHLSLRRLQQSLEDKNMQLEREIRERQRVELALQKANTQLEQLANSDGLTRIANRRQFDWHLKDQWNQATQLVRPISLILCDIDEFKQYNDYYGHLAGDDCLRKVAQAIRNVAERTDGLAARYGGEEFAAILPALNLEQVTQAAKMIQMNVKQLQINHAQSSINDYVTLSIGVSCLTPKKNMPQTALVALADEALYEAKRLGRNRIVIEPDINHLFLPTVQKNQ